MHDGSQARMCISCAGVICTLVATRGMARKAKAPIESPFKLKAWRQERGLTLDQVGEALGMTGQNYGKIERGGVELRETYLEPLADLYGIPKSALMQIPGHGIADTTETVPVVGYVSAGAELALYDQGQGPFDYVSPPRDSKPSTVAASVKGVSLGPLLDEALIFYDDVRSPVTADLHGKMCVVGLEDGRVVVKQLMPGDSGRFHLLSNSSEPPLLNETVAWAAKVTDIRPR